MNKKFCYRKVDFYNEAYIGGVFIRSINNEENRFMYILEEVHKDIKPLLKIIKRFKKDFKENKKNPADVYGALILKIKFNRISPLKKEFWIKKTKEEMVLDQNYRLRQYIKMFDNDRQGLYQIMVMPYHYETKKKKWILSNWLPVLSTITDEELGKIAVMSTSTQVDPSAKDMALYSIEWVKGLDVEAWELVENEKKKFEKNC